jgi:hypothetical protein
MVTKSRLLDQVREKIRIKRYSIRTEQAYLDWIRRTVSLSAHLYAHHGRMDSAATQNRGLL